MALTDDIKGYWQVAKNTQYLLSFVGLSNKFKRTQDFTYDTYTEFFSRDTKKLKRVKQRLARINNRFVTTTTLALENEFIKAHSNAIISLLGPDAQGAKLLEVGGGYGRTILALSCVFPQADFSALEYTAQGPVTARKYMVEGLEEIQGVAASFRPEAAKNQPRFVEFEQGDGKAIKYPDKSFDISYTNLVLEQIPDPSDHERIMTEMLRASGKAACFLEPWHDAQDLITLGFLNHNDYFRAKSEVLKRIGFSKVTFIPLGFQHNLKFKLGYVIAEV